MTPREKFDQLLAEKREERQSAVRRVEWLDGQIQALLDVARRLEFDAPSSESRKRIDRWAESSRLMELLRAAPEQGLSPTECSQMLGLTTAADRDRIKSKLWSWDKAGKVVKPATGRYKAKGADDGAGRDR